MNKSILLKKKIYLFFSLVFSFILFLYLSYIFINGERGILSYYKTKNQFNFYEKKFSSLVNTNKNLEDKINRLKTESLDLDYLDEQIRIKTGQISENEYLIILDK